MRSATCLCTLILAAPAIAQEKPAPLPDGIRLLRSIESAGKPGRDIVFLDKGQRLAAVVAAGIQTWDLATGQLAHTRPGVFLAIAVSPDGTTLAALDDKDEVHLFDLRSHRQVGRLAFTGAALAPDDGASDAAILTFSPDGKRLAIGCRKDIEVWDVASRLFSHRFGPGWGSRLGAIDFFPDSRRIARTGFPTFAVAVWDTTLKRNVDTLRAAKCIRTGRLSPDGSVFVAGIDLGNQGVVQFLQTVRRYDLGIRVSGSVNGIAFAPDSRVVAARTIAGKIHLIHCKSLQPIDAIDVAGLAEKTTPLGMAFSADGERFAADQGDRIAVWDIAEWRKKLAAYEKPTRARLESAWGGLTDPGDVSDEWVDVPAVHQLVGAPEQAIPLLAEKLRPAPPVDPTLVGRLIAELDSDRFNVRERATRTLIDFDGVGKTILAERLKSSVTLEQKRRIEMILSATSRDTSSKHLREYRAVWIAYIIGSPAALDLLRRWAGGDPDAFLTVEARQRLLRAERAKTAAGP